MGMFDTIHLPVPISCPRCGEPLESECQTKQLDIDGGSLTDYELPATCSSDRPTISLEVQCTACRRPWTLFIDLENGIMCRIRVPPRPESPERRGYVLWEIEPSAAVRAVIEERDRLESEARDLAGVAEGALLALAYARPDRLEAIRSLYDEVRPRPDGKSAFDEDHALFHPDKDGAEEIGLQRLFGIGAGPQRILTLLTGRPGLADLPPSTGSP